MKLTESVKRRIISAFIIFNIVAISFGTLKPSKEYTLGEAFFAPYLRWTRFIKEWRLFTPEPRRSIERYYVQIELKDGSLIIWRRPYPTNWGFFYRHLCYNFQKWDLAGHQLKVNRYLWNDVIAHMKRVYADKVSQMATISLRVEAAPLPPPADGIYIRDLIDGLKYSYKTIFAYSVDKNEFTL